MKLYSDIYNNKRLFLGGHLVTFQLGIAEVEDAAGKEILETGFAHIYAEMPSNEKAYREAIDKEYADDKLSYETEIARLKSIIEDKNKQIEYLKKDLQIWKDMVPDSTEDVKEVKIEEAVSDKEENTSLESMKKAELVALAVGEGYLSQTEASQLKKEELIKVIEEKLK